MTLRSKGAGMDWPVAPPPAKSAVSAGVSGPDGASTTSTRVVGGFTPRDIDATDTYRLGPLWVSRTFGGIQLGAGSRRWLSVRDMNGRGLSPVLTLRQRGLLMVFGRWMVKLGGVG